MQLPAGPGPFEIRGLETAPKSQVQWPPARARGARRPGGERLGGEPERHTLVQVSSY